MAAKQQIKETPILFSGEMVRAVLDDRKTQTRRIIKPQPPEVYEQDEFTGVLLKEQPATFGGKLSWRYGARWGSTPSNIPFPKCPYGEVGDRLWVREPFNVLDISQWCRMKGSYSRDNEPFDKIPTADEYNKCCLWKKGTLFRTKSSLFMFKSLARIWLEITNIRVERVQEISDADAEAEGLRGLNSHWNINGHERSCFGSLWDSLNAKRGIYETNKIWEPVKPLKKSVYPISFDDEPPRDYLYWPPFRDKLTGEWVGACIGDDPEGLMLDVHEPQKTIFYVGDKKVRVQLKKRKSKKLTEIGGYGWDKNPWVWVIEFEAKEK